MYIYRITVHRDLFCQPSGRWTVNVYRFPLRRRERDYPLFDTAKAYKLTDAVAIARASVRDWQRWHKAK